MAADALITHIECHSNQYEKLAVEINMVRICSGIISVRPISRSAMDSWIDAETNCTNSLWCQQ